MILLDARDRVIAEVIENVLNDRILLVEDEDYELEHLAADADSLTELTTALITALRRAGFLATPGGAS